MLDQDLKAGLESARILRVEELSAAIHKSTNTIRTYATNKIYQHLIPIPFKLPGSRRLCWLEKDVVAWILANRPQNRDGYMPRKRGRPTKAEQLHRERRKNTIPTQASEREGEK